VQTYEKLRQICGGYVPELFEIRKYQNHHFMVELGKKYVFSLVIRGFPLFSGPRIVETANNEGCLY
jgi:hypothetical protein